MDARTDGVTRGRSRSRRLKGALALLLTVGVLVFIAVQVSWEREVDIDEATFWEPSTLRLAVASCQESPEVVTMRQSGSIVEIKVVIQKSIWPEASGQDCQDPVEIDVEVPFTATEVLDLKSGETIPITRYPSE